MNLDIVLGAGFAALGLWIMVKWFKKFWFCMACIGTVKFACVLLIALWPQATFTIIPRTCLVPVEFVQHSIMMSVYHLGKGDEKEGMKVGKQLKKVWKTMEQIDSSQEK